MTRLRQAKQLQVRQELLRISKVFTWIKQCASDCTASYSIQTWKFDCSELNLTLNKTIISLHTKYSSILLTLLKKIEKPI